MINYWGGVSELIFGKHINKYYLKYGWMILLGLIALISVDFGQLKIPEPVSYTHLTLPTKA